MYIVVTLKMDEMPETIRDLAKARSWRIDGSGKTPPKVIVNPERHFDAGYSGSSVPEKK
jgi:hypothetical protein